MQTFEAPINTSDTMSRARRIRASFMPLAWHSRRIADHAAKRFMQHQSISTIAANSAEGSLVSSQLRTLMGMMVNHAQSLGDIEAHVQGLCDRGVGIGANAAAMRSASSALAESIKWASGPAWTTECDADWQSLCDDVCTMMFPQNQSQSASLSETWQRKAA